MFTLTETADFHPHIDRWIQDHIWVNFVLKKGYLLLHYSYMFYSVCIKNNSHRCHFKIQDKIQYAAANTQIIGNPIPYPPKSPAKLLKNKNIGK